MFVVTGKLGKLAVIGSGHLLTDKYINWEENDKIREILFDFLITNKITINEIDANDPEVYNLMISLMFYYKSNINYLFIPVSVRFIHSPLLPIFEYNFTFRTI